MYLIIALLLITGCTPLCPAGKYDKVQQDKFAYFESGKPKYVVQERGYCKNNVTTINQVTLNRDEWESLDTTGNPGKLEVK